MISFGFFLFNIAETMKSIFLSLLHLIWGRCGQEREEKNTSHLSSDSKTNLGIRSMLLEALFVVEQAATPRCRVQSSTEAGLHSFKLSV